MLQQHWQNGRRGLWGYGMVLGLLWLVLFRELHEEWTVNPAYNYGWGVPVLGLCLFWKAWQRRPAPAVTKARASFIVLTGLTVFYIFPILLVQEANPDWGMLDWLLASVVVQVTLSLAWYAGGWPWFRHFLVPGALALLAVPWPPLLERGLMQDVMQGATRLTAEGLTWLGVVTAQQGNVIELATRTAGFNEACGGLLSFPAALLMAIVVGELRPLSVARRLVLVGTSLAAALGLNVVRITCLTLFWAAHGEKIQATRHNPAEYLTFGLLVLAVGWAGWRLDARRPGLRRGESMPPPDRPGFRAFPAGASLVLVSWILSAETVTWLWYWVHERNAPPHHLAWTVAWPTERHEFQARKISEGLRESLRCDLGESGVWRRPDGTEWTMFFVKWFPSRAAARLARSHTPDVCLPAQGFDKVSDLGFTTLRVQWLEMPFNTYLFNGRGRHHYVFFCVMEEDAHLGDEQAVVPVRNHLEDLNRKRRFRAVLEGRRHRGQQVFEVAMTGYASAEEARRALEAALPRLIRISG